MKNKILTKFATRLLSRAIKVIDLNKKELKHGRILDSPWVKIPNVKSFNVQLNLHDPMFALFGIKRRYKPTLMLEGYKSNGMNRYLEHQILRLSKAKANPGLYWKLAKILMKRSNIFRVCAIQHVFRNWYRNYPLGFIINTNRKVSKLINQGLVDMEHGHLGYVPFEMDFKRVYIPKGEKGYRPLGVPKPEWRMLLHMYSNFLTYFLQDSLKGQHGFLPGKGTLTAWQEIFTKGLHNSRYIREWDFKGYFDSIYPSRISELLLDRGVPTDVVDFLENVNNSSVQLGEDRKLDESSQISRKEVRKIYGETVVTENQIIFENNVFEHNPDFEGKPNRFLQNLMKNKLSHRLRGVAQGSPTSPILANLVMDLWIKGHDNPARVGNPVCVAYADDSVSFSDQPILIDPPHDTGIIINEEKSSYVVVNGEWVKPLKFLGLQYDGIMFQANTRKGSDLKLDDKAKTLMEIYAGLKRDDYFYSIEDALAYINKKVETHEGYSPSGGVKLKNSWEDYFKSRLIGFVQSRLYQGNWNLENLAQDFSMKFVRGSWMDTKLCKENHNVFVASSYACHSLANILRHNQGFRKHREDPITMTAGKPK